MSFVVLEDNAERLAELVRVLRSVGYDGQLISFRRSDECIRWLSNSLPEVEGISLDHDLEKLDPEESDPGSGRDVAEWLAQQHQKVPVIIHSANVDAGIAMYITLEEASFPVERVGAIGDDWIECDWRRALQRCVLRERKSEQT